MSSSEANVIVYKANAIFSDGQEGSPRRDPQRDRNFSGAIGISGNGAAQPPNTSIEVDLISASTGEPGERPRRTTASGVTRDNSPPFGNPISTSQSCDN